MIRKCVGDDLKPVSQPPTFAPRLSGSERAVRVDDFPKPTGKSTNSVNRCLILALATESGEGVVGRWTCGCAVMAGTRRRKKGDRKKVSKSRIEEELEDDGFENASFLTTPEVMSRQSGCQTLL